MKKTGKTMTKDAIAARRTTTLEIEPNLAGRIIDALAHMGVLRLRRHRLHRRLRRGAASSASAAPPLPPTDLVEELVRAEAAWAVAQEEERAACWAAYSVAYWEAYWAEHRAMAAEGGQTG